MTAEPLTFKQLQDEVLEGTFDATKYRRRVQRWLNEGLGKFVRRVFSSDRQSSATITLVAGQSTYAQPAGIVRVRSLRDTSTGTELEEASIRELDARGTTARGKPTTFALDGSNIVVWPTPSAAGALTLRDWAGAATMDDDGDVPEIPADYHEALVSYARSRAYRAEDDLEMAVALMNDFNAAVIEARGDLQRTSQAAVRQVPGMFGRPSAGPTFVRPQ